MCALDYVYTRAKVFGFVKVSGFLVFQIYGSARRLHYTQPDTAMFNIKLNNFNPLSDIMRCSCFYPVWQLNLIAINLKNIHRNKLIQILYGKPFTRVFSLDSNVSGYEVPTNLSGFKVSGHSTKPRRFTHRIRRCVCKRQHESGTKTLRFRDESEKFRSSVKPKGGLSEWRSITAIFACLIIILLQSFVSCDKNASSLTQANTTERFSSLVV